jgi:hypothetical protein
MSKTRILLIVLMLGVAGMASAQRGVQKMYMYKSGFGVIYMLNDSIELSTKQTAGLLFSHEKAYTEFKQARKWLAVSALTGFSGMAMLAIPLGTVIFGEHADLGFAAGGGALIAVGLISNWVYKGRAFGAIELYNQDLPQTTSRIRPQLQFYGTGARLVIKF